MGYNLHLPEYRNLALGTDGIGSDMLEELKFAYFKHKDAGGALWPDSFARFLWNGNRLLGATSAPIWPAGAGLQGRPHHLRLRRTDPLAPRNLGGHPPSAWAHPRSTA